MRIRDDTIAAISTPIGEGAIGIIRISGKDAINVAEKMFRIKRPLDIKNIESHRLHFGHIVDGENSQIADEGMIALLREPNSFTREDMVEIYCHGGEANLRRILRIVIENGAKLAEPGEFTKRAFLNGRIDLIQAEAINEIIRSDNEIGLQNAFLKIKGVLSEKINYLNDRIKTLITTIEAIINFPEEVEAELDRGNIRREIQELLFEINYLLTSAGKRNLINRGIKVAIIGSPNVGKSSLFNSIIEEERAVVTPTPGTTRDQVRATLMLEGVNVEFIDTAGIRETDEDIEIESIKRTQWALDEADVVIVVLDAHKGIDEKDREIVRMAAERFRIIALNKIDLPARIQEEYIMSEFEAENIIRTSALKKINIQPLVNFIIDKYIKERVDDIKQDIVVRNLRQIDCLRKTKKELEDAQASLINSFPLEFTAYNLKKSTDYLGELVGETTDEEITERIFRDFCIGK